LKNGTKVRPIQSAIKRITENYNAEVERWVEAGKLLPVEKFISTDARYVKWTRSLRGHLAKARTASFDENRIVTADSSSLATPIVTSLTS